MSRRPDHPMLRRNDHDPAANLANRLLFDHHSDGALRSEKDAAKVDGHDRVPILLRRLEQPLRPTTRDAGVAHHHVETTAAPDSGGHEAIDVGGAGRIGARGTPHVPRAIRQPDRRPRRAPAEDRRRPRTRLRPRTAERSPVPARRTARDHHRPSLEAPLPSLQPTPMRTCCRDRSGEGWGTVEWARGRSASHRGHRRRLDRHRSHRRARQAGPSRRRCLRHRHRARGDVAPAGAGVFDSWDELLARSVSMPSGSPRLHFCTARRRSLRWSAASPSISKSRSRGRSTTRWGIAAAAEASGVVCAIGYQWHAAEALELLRAAVGDQQVAYLSGVSAGPTAARPWFLERSGGGGNLLERGSHQLDLQRAVAGRQFCSGCGRDGAPRPDRDRGRRYRACGHDQARFASVAPAVPGLNGPGQPGSYSLDGLGPTPRLGASRTGRLTYWPAAAVSRKR